MLTKLMLEEFKSLVVVNDEWVYFNPAPGILPIQLSCISGLERFRGKPYSYRTDLRSFVSWIIKTNGFGAHLTRNGRVVSKLAGPICDYFGFAHGVTLVEFLEGVLLELGFSPKEYYIHTPLEFNVCCHVLYQKCDELEQIG